MPETLDTEIQALPEGNVKSYDAEVEAASVTKEDVEARLRSTTESISMRLDAIQDEIGSTGESVKKVLTDNPLATVLLAVAAGFTVGLIATGRSKNSDGVPKSVINGIASSIGEALEDGLLPDEAALSALTEFESYLKPPSSPVKKKSVSRMIVQAGLSMLVRQGINHFKDSGD